MTNPTRRNLRHLCCLVIACLLWLLVLGTRSKADGISGQVLDGAGAGVSGVLATLRLENRTFLPVCIRSDKDGRFAFNGLAAGQYFIQLSDPKFIFTPAERTVTLKTGGKPSLKFWAIPLPASVVPPQQRLTDADVISVLLGGVSSTSAVGSMLKFEFKSGAAPVVVPLGQIVAWGYVRKSPQ